MPEIAIEIGGMPILIRTASAEFARLLARRYGGFAAPSGRQPLFELDVQLIESALGDPDEDVSVTCENGVWLMRRGDFRAEWNPSTRRGLVRQTLNPYSIDAVLRILHSLLLARQGGLLIHAASAIRNGRAFLFAGVSGAGKTTISRLAPPDATLLTDEISYVRPAPAGASGYFAHGTPFAGELAQPGENASAPIGALYFLAQGSENRIHPLEQPDALRELLASVLFFAHEPELANLVFASACELVRQLPVYRLTFFPDSRVWAIIQ